MRISINGRVRANKRGRVNLIFNTHIHIISSVDDDGGGGNGSGGYWLSLSAHKCI